MKFTNIITKFFTRNIFLKIISLIIASFIWITVVSEKKSEIGFVVPLQYQNIPEKMEIVGNTLQNVEIQIRGFRREINKISSREIKVRVSLARDKEGKNIHFLANENIKVGEDLEIVQIKPYKIEVLLEHSVTKKVPIMPVIFGKPKDGFRMEQMVIVPQNSSIVGPKSEVEKINYVRTSQFDFSGLGKSVSRRLPIVLDNPHVRLIDKTPPKITVTIVEIFDYKIFNNHPVLNKTGLNNIKISPSNIKVILRGPQKKLKNLTAKDIQIFLEADQVSKAKKSSFYIVPMYQLPEQITLEEMLPEKIKCNILE